MSEEGAAEECARVLASPAASVPRPQPRLDACSVDVLDVSIAHFLHLEAYSVEVLNNSIAYLLQPRSL